MIHPAGSTRLDPSSLLGSVITSFEIECTSIWIYVYSIKMVRLLSWLLAVGIGGTRTACFKLVVL